MWLQHRVKPIHNPSPISAKEPYISAKEPHISAKEPCISAKEMHGSFA